MRSPVVSILILAACGNVTAELPDAGTEPGDDAPDAAPTPTSPDATPVPATWTSVGGAAEYTAFAVAADPAAGVVLAALGGTGNDCAQAPHQPGCAIVRSTDDGATFAPVTAGLDFVDARAIAVNGAVAIAATRGAF